MRVIFIYPEAYFIYRCKKKALLLLSQIHGTKMVSAGDIWVVGMFPVKGSTFLADFLPECVCQRIHLSSRKGLWPCVGLKQVLRKWELFCSTS